MQDDDMAPPTLADITRRLRGNSTQEVFGQAVGISPSLIAHVERGTRSFSVDNVEKIIRGLGLDGDDALALRRARDRLSGTKEPSIPAQVAALERTLGRQLDRIEEAVTGLAETSMIVDYERINQMIADSNSRSDERIEGLTAIVEEVSEQVRILYRALGSYESGESTLPDQELSPQQLPRSKPQRPSPPTP